MGSSHAPLRRRDHHFKKGSEKTTRMQQPTTHEVILQSIIAFCVLFVLARILGKRQIVQLTFFDYIAGLTLGNIAASWSLDEVKTLHAIIALVIWAFLSVTLAFIERKFYRARTALDGRPTVLIKKWSNIGEETLKRAHVNRRTADVAAPKGCF